MLSPKKCRELLGKEYKHLSDEDLNKLITQLYQLADIAIDLSTGDDNERAGESPTSASRKRRREPLRQKMKRKVDYIKKARGGRQGLPS